MYKGCKFDIEFCESPVSWRKVSAKRRDRLYGIPNGSFGFCERYHHWLACWLLPSLMTMKTLLTAALLLASASPALAQKEIPKAEGHDQCPLGYLNTLGTTCVSPIYYEVAPTNGKACKQGWMNIGAGYSKKKKGLLGIL